MHHCLQSSQACSAAPAKATYGLSGADNKLSRPISGVSISGSENVEELLAVLQGIAAERACLSPEASRGLEQAVPPHALPNMPALMLARLMLAIAAAGVQHEFPGRARCLFRDALEIGCIVVMSGLVLGPAVGLAGCCPGHCVHETREGWQEESTPAFPCTNFMQGWLDAALATAESHLAACPPESTTLLAELLWGACEMRLNPSPQWLAAAEQEKLTLYTILT
eukprot:1150311-Pelagomonas_calceolata.AAC.1